MQVVRAFFGWLANSSMATPCRAQILRSSGTSYRPRSKAGTSFACASMRRLPSSPCRRLARSSHPSPQKPPLLRQQRGLHLHQRPPCGVELLGDESAGRRGESLVGLPRQGAPPVICVAFRALRPIDVLCDVALPSAEIPRNRGQRTEPVRVITYLSCNDVNDAALIL